MHVLVPMPKQLDNWTTICDPMTMNQHLLECSQMHFHQAHDTPFTQPLLSDLLNFDGLTLFGDVIYQGKPIPNDLDIDPTTCLLLFH